MISVGPGERPFEVIKEGVRRITEAASEEVEGGVQLGTLKKKAHSSPLKT